MAKSDKTSDKPAKKPGKGGYVLPDAPKPFTKDNQPSSEAKSAGWKKKRAERLLTQKILEQITKGKNLQLYVNSLIRNAKKGNAKAIETINKGIEEDVLKIASTDVEGNDAVDWMEKLTFEQLYQLKHGSKPKS